MILTLRRLAFKLGAAGQAAPTVISCATRDGFYDRLLDRMAASARGAGLAVSTETIPPCDRKAWGPENPWAACLLYLSYSEGAFRLLDTWIALCANDLVKGYDHERLGLALAAMQGQVRLRDLSAAVDGRFERDAGLWKENRAWG